MKHIKYNKLTSILIFTISIVVGLVFLISGTSKLFVFNSFEHTVTLFLPFLEKVSVYIASSVIALEIVLGAMLIFRVKIAFTSAALSILLMFFIGLLLYEAMTGSTIRCRCFGGLNISFPTKVQLVFDLFLLNGLILLNFLQARKNISTNKSKWYTWIIPVFSIIIIEASLILTVWNPKKPDAYINVSNLFDFISAKNKMALDPSKGNAFFLISFYDFSCPLCYDDFLALSDSIHNSGKKNKLNIIYIFEKNSLESESMDSVRLESWKHVNNIDYPTLLADNQIFEENYIKKSSIIVFNDNRELIFKEEFPVGVSKRHKILTYLSN